MDDSCDTLEALSKAHDQSVITTINNMELFQMQLDAVVVTIQLACPDCDIKRLMREEFFRLRIKRLLDMQATASHVKEMRIRGHVTQLIQKIRVQAREEGYQDVMSDVMENYKPQTDVSMFKTVLLIKDIPQI